MSSSHLPGTGVAFWVLHQTCLTAKLWMALFQARLNASIPGRVTNPLFFFCRQSGPVSPSKSRLVTSSCLDLYSTSLQWGAQLDQHRPDSHVWPQRGEVRCVGGMVGEGGREWRKCVRDRERLREGSWCWLNLFLLWCKMD